VRDRTIVEGEADIAPGPYALLSVTDTGHGMDTRTLTHLFEPFFTTREVGRGSGMALAAAHGFVRQSGGHIEVESAPGRGTTLKIYLPLLAEAKPATDREQRGLVPASKEMILLAEDDEGVRGFTLHLLRRLGHPVLEATSGTEALEIASRTEGPI